MSVEITSCFTGMRQERNCAGVQAVSVQILFRIISPNNTCVGGAQGPKVLGSQGPWDPGAKGPRGPRAQGPRVPRGPRSQGPRGLGALGPSNLYDKDIMYIANKKLRSLRPLRSNWLFIATKTPLASLARSKFLVLQIFSPAGTVHFLLHIYMDHACCKCNVR